MVTIIQEDLIKKIYEETGNRTRGECFVKDKEIWFGFRLVESKKYLFSFLVDSYNTKNEAEKIVKEINEVFRK